MRVTSPTGKGIGKGAVTVIRALTTLAITGSRSPLPA
jgi:hypothetical protein